jgi:hypothetical protein
LYDLKHPGPELELERFKKKLCSLSWYVKEIKQGFSRYFNKKYGRRGTLWGERFKSLIVEDGLTLVNLLAYVDLNAVRAGIVERPEEYRVLGCPQMTVAICKIPLPADAPVKMDIFRDAHKQVSQPGSSGLERHE